MSKITAIHNVGDKRPPCQETVRVAAGLKTHTAQRREFQQRKRGLPIDQCGARSAYNFNGRSLCAPHAGAVALDILRKQSAAKSQAVTVAFVQAGSTPPTWEAVFSGYATEVIATGQILDVDIQTGAVRRKALGEVAK